MVELRFLPVEDADAFSPPAMRVGRMTPIGKIRNPDGTLTIVNEPATVVLDGEHEPSDRAFLRGEVLGGRIQPADDLTARALEVPFSAPATDAPAPKAKAKKETDQ